MDARPLFSAVQDAFGVGAVVTPPGGPAVEVVAVWLALDTAQVPPGGDLRRAEPKRVLCLPLAGLPLVPRGTIVSVPEFNGADVTDWRIDAAADVQYDHYRVIVLPVTVAT